MRQRNQQHQRSRVMLVSREGTSASSLNSLGFHHKWKAINPLCPRRQRCFLTPPPSTGPKILPPVPLLQHSPTTSQEPPFSKDKNNNLPPCSSNRPSPPPQLEEKQKDEEEQKDGNSLAKPTPAYTPMPACCRAYSSVANRMMDQRIQQSQMGTRPFGPPPRTNPSTGTAPTRNLQPIPIPIPTIFGIAPAVHIRSVVPVCAAPPMRPAVNTAAVQKKEGEMSVATSMLNGLHL